MTNPRYKYFGLALVLVAASVLTATLINQPSRSLASAQSCPKTGQNHQVVIDNNHVSPEGTYARLCDSLTIINRDKVTREIGFGPHDHHQPYDGVYEHQLKQGEKFTITLSQAGLYHLHDHFDEAAAGYFSVDREH